MSPVDKLNKEALKTANISVDLHSGISFPFSKYYRASNKFNSSSNNSKIGKNSTYSTKSKIVGWNKKFAINKNDINKNKRKLNNQLY